MKNMNETMEKLMSVTNKNGKLSAKANEAMNVIKNMVAGQKYHFIQWKRSGGYSNLCGTKHLNVCKVLDLLGIKYETGNDAPRGGVEGTYVMIDEQAAEAIKVSVKEAGI